MISWIRIIDTSSFHFVTTSSKSDIHEYFKAKLWRHDKWVVPFHTPTFQVINYEQLSPNNPKLPIIESNKHKLTLFIGRCYHQYSDNFAFDIDKTYFNQLTQAQQKQQLPQILKNKFSLTNNNIEYLRFIATGATSKEIALHLNRSFRSVEGHIASLSKKLNCQSRNQLV